MHTPYEWIVRAEYAASGQSPGALAELIAWAEGEGLTEATTDEKKILLLVIDMQNDFMEGIGSLGVPGSKHDLLRLSRWIYDNLSGLSRIVCSLDTHSLAQIFHPAWWTDAEGRHPEPYTIITAEQVQQGLWRPFGGDVSRSLAYLRHLETEGKKQLCIWPYHCLEGSSGADVEAELLRMIYFHAAARRTQPLFIRKGSDPYTEMYGILKPEYDSQGYLNESVLEEIEKHDAVYLAGEASSHCLLESCRQIVEHYAGRPDVLRRLTVLSDCASAIPGYEQETEEAYRQLSLRYGLALRKSEDAKL